MSKNHRHRFVFYALRLDKPRGLLAVVRTCVNCQASWMKPNGMKWEPIVRRWRVVKS